MKKALAIFLLVPFAVLFAAEPVEFTVGSLTFQRPEGWAWITPSSPMRKAQLAVSGAEGSAEVTFFHFGAGQGGSVQANVARWIGQFQDGTSDTKTEPVGKLEVTFVKAAGTFLSGMPGGPTTPQPGYAMRGAILPAAGGDVYVKMTGPEAVVKSAEGAFEKMVHEAAR